MYDNNLDPNMAIATGSKNPEASFDRLKTGQFCNNFAVEGQRLLSSIGGGFNGGTSLQMKHARLTALQLISTC